MFASVLRPLGILPAMLAAGLLTLPMPGANGTAEAKGFKGSFARGAAVSGARALTRGRDDEEASNATPAASTASAAEIAAERKAADQATPDYYTKRAQKLLKGQARPSGPHPLAVANPGMDVVVCMAGCRSDRAEIVYMQHAKATTTVGEMQQSAAVPGSATSGPTASHIVCIGGCYEKSRIIASPVAASGLGEWTTAAPSAGAPAAPAKRAGSGDWMRTIDGARSEPGKP